MTMLSRMASNHLSQMFTITALSLLIVELTASYQLPFNKPFLTVWNSPTYGCNQYGLNLSYFDIVINQNQSFQGNDSVIFYQVGQFPYYSGSTPVNGGLPQLGNLTANFQVARSLINKLIPYVNFSGIAVYDWETWRANYLWNFDSLSIYQTQSKILVQKQHPTWNSSMVGQEAEKEWNKAALDFMGGTLNLARKMRPYAYWGYYSYPKCYGGSSDPQDKQCLNNSMEQNDQIANLYRNSTALFPRIYLSSKNTTSSTSERLFITRMLNESIRIRDKYSPKWAEILPYSSYRFIGSGEYFDTPTLDMTMKQSADSGAAGVVLWGSSSWVKTKQECIDLVNYVDTVLGPYTQELTDFTNSCSQDMCSNHGRCVLKENMQDDTMLRFKPYPKKKQDPYAGYICRCYYNWTGQTCNTPL